MVTTRSQVKYGNGAFGHSPVHADCVTLSNAATQPTSVEDVPSQIDEVEVIASTKSNKRTSSQTAQSGKAATKRATKKAKQIVKSAPDVVTKKRQVI